ncbi:hypothetical protein [Pseudophaeobacter sp.]|uniref:hypothetical protein n=1 Tax=Pseudophaeobacter sp. TaxID=1971739 RepID=UPI003298A0B4
MAERTGGSDQGWKAAETALLEKWQHLSSMAQLKPLDTDEKGRNLLMQSAAKGYGFAVAYLLSLPELREIIDLRDAKGLSAYDMAQLANTQTLLACHPDQEKMNPFVLVPFLVTQPYYTSRAPFPEITRMLAQAGATEDLTAARRFWLETCSNKDAKLRARVNTTTALHEELIMEQARQVRLSCFTRAARSMEQVRELLAESWSGERMATAEAKFRQETLEKCGGTRWPDEVPYSQ